MLASRIVRTALRSMAPRFGCIGVSMAWLVGASFVQAEPMPDAGEVAQANGNAASADAESSSYTYAVTASPVPREPKHDLSDSEEPAELEPREFEPPEYVEGAPVPDGYEVQSRHYKGLIIGGAISFGLGYLAPLWVLADDGFSGRSGYFLIPVAGPYLWLATGKFDGDCGDMCIDPRLVVGAIAVAQTTGAVLLLSGLFVPHKELVKVNDARIHLAPMATGMARGLTLWGEF